MTSAGLLQVVRELAEASGALVNGDPEPFKSHWSQADDVTIFGGYGKHEQGWAQVSSRLDWASARFHAGEINYELLTAGSSGDLGYAVGIERGHATVVNHGESGEIVLRVTHLFRRENGRWAVIHRHADTVTEIQAPSHLLHDR
jgi:ketosteroid isomerase-like protein